MGRIVLTCEDKKWKVAGEEAGRAIRRSLFLLKKKKCGVELHLVSDQTMRKLNRAFRKKNVPTNVLSFEAKADFPRPDIAGGGAFLGEIYLAPDVIRERGESLPCLALHGLLHLAGYTHTQARDRITMERVELRLWKRLFPRKPFFYDHRT